MCLLSAIVAGVFILIAAQGLPQLPENLDQLVNTTPTVIYDSEGRILQSLGGREAVGLERISPYFLKAIMAAEDKNFYRHHGVDKIAILRSIYVGIFTSRRIAGGSTITQQLAKNLFFSFDRSLTRKLREMLIAVQIEAQFSKEEILQAYCNQIPFGSRANGIERAARAYFGIPASDLSLAQAALLAGLPNSPSRLNPFVHPLNAQARQHAILRLMLKKGFITPEELSTAEAEVLQYKSTYSSVKGEWFADRVIEECEGRFGKEAVYFGGLKIYTTLRPRLQAYAEAAVKAGVDNLNTRLNTDSLQGALIAVSPLSGAVWAHVGGVDYGISQFDRAVDAKRRPGSGFKPFLYYTAIDKYGYNPATVVLDSIFTTPVQGALDWTVANYEREYFGPVILKFALSKSLNTVAARIVTNIDAAAVAATAKKWGIKSELQPNLSIALGTSAVSPLEMASAFSVIATEGLYYEPYFIERVESLRGETLYEHFISGRRVADQVSIYLLLDMMKEVLKSGTAASARTWGFSYPAAGKTGTTDDYVDSWFTGFTPSLCASAWVGFDLERAMKEGGTGITGASGALPIWVDFMKKSTAEEPPQDFTLPIGVKFVSLDIKTGMLSEGAGSMMTALREETEVEAERDSVTAEEKKKG